MKLLLDQNLPSRALRNLEISFPGSAHVKDIGLQTAGDIDLWTHAVQHGFSIVTKDVDFRDIVGLRGFPPKVILVRWGNISNTLLIERFIASTAMIRRFLEDHENGLLELW